MPPLLAYLPTPDLLWHFDQVTRDHLSAFATPSVEEAKRMLERADVGALVLEPKDDSGRTTLPLISYLAERRPTLPIVLYSTIDPSAVRFVTEITRHSSNIRHVVLHRFDDAPHRFRSLLRSLEQNKETAPPIESRVTVVGDTISQELIDYLAQHPDELYSLKPRRFEELVAELLAKQGFEVETTKQTRDGGKDIIVRARTSLGLQVYYVECKRYSPDNPVGVSLVRELFGVVQSDRVTGGVLATTSVFSRAALSFQSKAPYQLSLRDKDDLRQWLEEARRR